MVNSNCGKCGMLNHAGFCKLTACIYPCSTGMGGYINKPITNADKIRAMTDEELAYYLNGLTGDGCPPLAMCKYPDEGHRYKCSVRKCWLDWLKEESE